MTTWVALPPPPGAPRWQGRPPGAIFYLASGVAILIAVDASSRDSLWMFVIGAAVWVAIAVVWCLRLALTAARSGLRMPVAAWARWMTIPAAMGLVFVIGLSGVLFGERFAASRGALDQMAAEVMAGFDRTWLGGTL